MEYMISGSIAQNFYCVPRMTLDADIVLELPTQRVDEFVTLFPDSYLDPMTVRDEVRRRGMFNVIHLETGFKLDFILRKNSEYHRLAFQRRLRKKGVNSEFWIIELNDLILAKLIWIQDSLSEKQMTDIRNLLAHPGKDEPYLRQWCGILNLQSFGLFENE